MYLNLDQDGEEIWIQIMDDSNIEVLADIKEEKHVIGLDEVEEIVQKPTSTARRPSRGKRPCNACGVSFKFLSRHLNTHGPHNCTDCLLHFPTRELYDEHMRSSHNTEQESHNCKICGLGFSSLTNLALHNFKHTEVYSCPLCNFTVKGRHKHSLINHIKRHEGQYSVFCEVCGQGFIEKHILATHTEIHEAIPKYECEFCKKKFTVKR